MASTALTDPGDAPPIQVSALASGAVLTSHNRGIDLLYRDADLDRLAFVRLAPNWTEVPDPVLLAEGTERHTALSTPEGQTFIFSLDPTGDLNLQRIDEEGQRGSAITVMNRDTARDLLSFGAARSGEQLFAVVFTEGSNGRQELGWARSTLSLEPTGLDQTVQINTDQHSHMALAARPSGGFVIALMGTVSRPIFLIRIPEDGPWDGLIEPEDLIQGANAPLDLGLIEFEDGLMLVWIEGNLRNYALRGMRLDAEGSPQGEVLDFTTIENKAPRLPLALTYRPLPAQPPSPWFIIGLSEGRNPSPDRATARLFSRSGVPFCFE